MFYASIAAILLLGMAAVLGTGFGTGSFSKSQQAAANSTPVSTPTSTSPTPGTGGTTTYIETPRATRIREYLSSVAVNGAQTFSDPHSPESQALLWLQSEDPLALDPNNIGDHLQLEQRYALLTLWYNSQFEWYDQTNWLNSNECTWFGVTCQAMTSGGRSLQGSSQASLVVTALSLESNNLQGTIPQDIVLLQYLRTLNLSKNQLQGGLPKELKKLALLQELYLDTNMLAGSLSNLDMSGMVDLTTLDISYNGFTDKLPDAFWSLKSLEQLVLDRNDFTGGVPSQIGNAQSLSKWQPTLYYNVLLLMHFSDT